MQACKDLVNDLGIFSREFTKEWELRKMVGEGAKADEKNGDNNDR
jgi:DNA-directed RNA polymerase II subunit RPB11